MTKEINNLKTRFNLWREKSREKEKIKELEKAKNSIIYHLTVSLTTEESIKMFNQVEEEYRDLMKSRLKAVSVEKVVLEEFLLPVSQSFSPKNNKNRRKICTYKVKIEFTEEMLIEEAYNLEQRFLKEFENHKYTPKIKFKGYTECLTTNPVAEYYHWFNNK